MDLQVKQRTSFACATLVGLLVLASCRPATTEAVTATLSSTSSIATASVTVTTAVSSPTLTSTSQPTVSVPLTVTSAATASTTVGSLSASPSTPEVQPSKPTPASDPNNLDFEHGDLSQWTVVNGTVWTDKSVQHVGDTTTYGQHGNYFLFGFANGDQVSGELQSVSVILQAPGRVSLLVGGGCDIKTVYVALVRASDDTELFKATGKCEEALSPVSWDASAHVGTEVYIKVVDNASDAWGHINLDDVRLPRNPSNTSAPTQTKTSG
jgi:fructan beta-fructosidase